MIKGISNNEFNLKVDVKFNNILEGYNKYKVVELFYNEQSKYVECLYIDLLKIFFNKDKSLIIDFYKKNLNIESINYIKSNITLEESILLDEILNTGDKETIYFEINDEKYLDLLTKLNTRELFFITFYFYKSNITIWGNYNMKFPLFYKDIYEAEYYLNIAKNKNLL